MSAFEGTPSPLSADILKGSPPKESNTVIVIALSAARFTSPWVAFCLPLQLQLQSVSRLRITQGRRRTDRDRPLHNMEFL